MRFLHIVSFGEYCKQCKHFEKSESEDPCWNCLDNPVNDESKCPVYFEEREKMLPTNRERSKETKIIRTKN